MKPLLVGSQGICEDHPALSGLRAGFELCDHLHEISPRIHVLLATGSEYVTVAEARAKGFCGMLPKPFSSAALRREITLLQADE